MAKRTKSALKANRQNIKRREHNRTMMLLRKLPTSNSQLPTARWELVIGSWELTGFNYSFQYFARCGVTALMVASPRGVGPSGVRSLDFSPASAPIDARKLVANPTRS